MNFLRHNAAEKLIAAALTLLLFWSVQRTHVADSHQTFSKRLGFENVPKGMKVVGEAPLIQITAAGDPPIIESLGPDSAVVSVHLGSARRGTAAYQVYLSLPPRLYDSVKWTLSPKVVDLTLAGETDISITVRPVPIKPLPTGFNLRNWVAEPDTIMVSGDERKIAKVAGGRLMFDPTDMSSAGDLRDIVLVDKMGRMLQDEFTLSPQRGRIVPSSTSTITRLISVTPQWTGALPPNRRMVGFRVTPAQVQVQGVSVVLDALNELVTKPIDLTGIDRDRTITVPLVTPEGVRLREGSSVQVKIEVEATEGR